ncbi:unnamed protein product, partial [Rhizoctonia solani]
MELVPVGVTVQVQLHEIRPTITFQSSLSFLPSPSSSVRRGLRHANPDPQDEPQWDMIDELQSHGINAQDITKLKKEGICTVSAVRMTSRRNLLKIKGMSEAKVDKIKEAAQKILGSSFQTGAQVSEKRKRVLQISSGSKSVDGMLGGGFMSQSISEVYGEFRTGKTQLAHTLSVMAQLPPEMGGGSGKVTYIDTEGRVDTIVFFCSNLEHLYHSPRAYVDKSSLHRAGTFRPDRIRAIADRFGVDPEQTLENITYARAYNSEHQMELIQEAGIRFAEEKNFRLLIVDSIMALFRTDYSGRGELSERQQKLAQMLAKLSKLSEEFNVRLFDLNFESSSSWFILDRGTADEPSTSGSWCDDGICSDCQADWG